VKLGETKIRGVSPAVEAPVQKTEKKMKQTGWEGPVVRIDCVGERGVFKGPRDFDRVISDPKTGGQRLSRSAEKKVVKGKPISEDAREELGI